MRSSTSTLLFISLAILLASVGCSSLPGTAGSIVAQQTPGVSSGAGATFQGPANSAAPSTQVATRRVGYYPPPVRQWPLPVTGIQPVSAAALPAEPSAPPPASTSASGFTPPSAPPAPAWIDEHTETTFGQHQDAAGIVKVAVSMGRWGRARWFGILCCLAAVGGLLWAHNNPEGYPVVCWKIGAVGIFLAVFDPSPWWLLLLIIPAGFYLLQKLGLLRLPGL